METAKPHIAICLGRQLGAGGREIGLRLAEALHLNFYDKEVITIAAKRSGFSNEVFEARDEEKSTLHSFITSMFPMIGHTNLYANQMGEEALFNILSSTIRDIAENEDCLIVGRCAEYILRHHPRMTSVFVTANEADRLTRIATARNVSKEEALQIIHRGDRRRAAFHDFYCNNRWGHAETYDLCVNSSQLGIEGTCNLVVNFIKERYNR